MEYKLGNLSESIAKERVKSFDSDVNGIVSPCVLWHTNLKSASDKSVEFSLFALGRLRGVKK